MLFFATQNMQYHAVMEQYPFTWHSLAHNVGPGDEIIMPTLTYIATANTVKYCGATPVFIDSEERHGILIRI